MNPYAEIAGYAELEAAAARVETLLREISETAVASPAQVQIELVERIARGDDFTAQDLLDAMARAQLGAGPVALVADMLRAAAIEFPHRLQAFRGRHADAALRILDRRLRVLFATAREALHVLGDVDTIDRAVRAGKGDDWTVLADLVVEYRALREQQLEITCLAYGLDLAPRAAREISRFGLVRDARRWPPLSLEVDGTAEPTIRATLGKPTTAVSPEPPWPVDDPAALLRWCDDHDAEPWIPTTRELRGEVAAHDRAVSDAAMRREGRNPDRARERSQAAAARMAGAVDRARRSDQLRRELDALSVPAKPALPTAF